MEEKKDLRQHCLKEVMGQQVERTSLNNFLDLNWLISCLHMIDQSHIVLNLLGGILIVIEVVLIAMVQHNWIWQMQAHQLILILSSHKSQKEAKAQKLN